MNRPKTKILVDGGDPQDTQRIKKLLGFVDGQTTNPTLIARNPHIRQLIAAGHKATALEELRSTKENVMPVYEFLCKHCHRKFSKILITERDRDNKISCPYCGSDDVEKR